MNPSLLCWPPIRAAVFLLAATLAFAAGLGIAHAQSDPENAVIHDLATREGLPESAIDVLRLDAVTWSDACLGAAADGEVCAQTLTDGWIIWLASGDSGARYHTKLDGSASRLAARMLSPRLAMLR